MRKTTPLVFIYFAAILASCTFTTTKSKDPVFTDVKKVQSDLGSLVKAENINLTGKEITINKKVTNELEVAITNGSNVPATDAERKALEKTIATSIKSNLQDPNEYDNYTVLFVTKVEGGAATKRTWTGDVFSSKEL